ncbi:MAG: hypothetical protein AAFU78_07785 [Cyanobacteria bacterium J06633_2]
MGSHALSIRWSFKVGAIAISKLRCYREGDRSITPKLNATSSDRYNAWLGGTTKVTAFSSLP